MGLHSLFHSLKRRFVGMTRQIPALGLGTAAFQWTTLAVADSRLIDSVALAQLFECQSFSCGALILIVVRVVTEFGPFKVLLVATGGVDGSIRRHKRRDAGVLTCLKLGTIGITCICRDTEFGLLQLLFDRFGHRFELAIVGAFLSDFVVQNQAMFGVHGTLNVVGHEWAGCRSHFSCIGLAHNVLNQTLSFHQHLAGLVIGLFYPQLRKRCLHR
ncbi:hypothetical protein AN403_5723 [Pseudomonas fluorescens]|uniref:Uncharacterized protein n=1 Tax=Pseudomonas fluorescens TaxID=294 RepID=A0A0P8Z847_PSEFL|nr:hypothetical protein AN403_5723 [Pseudomonas fluorescens]